jgi:hypothetical protein
MAVKKRYCEHCDGVNSGGFYDDICIIQELKQYEQYLFDDEKDFDGNYGCQVPAKVWREANDCYGEWDCGFAICDALRNKREGEC